MNTPTRLVTSLLLATGTVFLAAPGLASAQTAEEVCVSPSFENDWLVTGRSNRTEEVAVAIPAGEIRIPFALATDSYEGRTSVNQASERWGLEFLAADGTVLGTSVSTGDVPDNITSGSWSGSLGSVTVASDVARIVAVHRDAEPADGSPNSVHVSGLTLCWDAPVSGPTTTATGSNPSSTSAPEPSGPTTVLAPSTTAPAPAGPTTTQRLAVVQTTAAPPSGSLPLTGAESGLLAGAGALLLAGGLGLVIASKRSNAKAPS